MRAVDCQLGRTCQPLPKKCPKIALRDFALFRLLQLLLRASDFARHAAMEAGIADHVWNIEEQELCWEAENRTRIQAQENPPASGLLAFRMCRAGLRSTHGKSVSRETTGFRASSKFLLGIQRRCGKSPKTCLLNSCL
jgi:hypothetical protein